MLFHNFHHIMLDDKVTVLKIIAIMLVSKWQGGGSLATSAFDSDRSFLVRVVYPTMKEQHSVLLVLVVAVERQSAKSLSGPAPLRARACHK